MTLPTAAQLDALRNQADPPADELLAQLVAEQGPAQAKATFDLLIRRVEMPLAELPPLVQDYWQSHQQLPARLDQEQLRIAQDFFVDHGPKLLVILYYKSLPMLYSCVKGAEVLVKTARLDRPQGDWRIFARRVAETAQFLLGVMRPGGLVNVGEGVQLIQKVRLIHASIRHFLLADGWDQSAFGLPINQEDMAITLCSFGISTLNGLERMGVEVAEEQKEAYVHVWSAVGEMLGIVPELLPDSVAAARALEEAILERQSGPSLAGQTLASALVQFAQERLNSRLLQTAPESLIRYFVGEKMAADLGLNHLPGCLSGLVPELLAGFFRKGERLEERSQPALQLLFDELSKVTMKAMFKYFDNYKQRTFVL
ncbi:MAG: oxygenase MpaB family protein, partial [Bacteroidota bacterium]